MSAGWAGAQTREHAPGASLSAAGAVAVLATLLLVVASIAGLQGAALQLAGPASGRSGVESPSTLARRDIPPRYLQLYELAAQRYGQDWAILAAIGKVECDHGRDPDPACTREGATNSAGAGGPMQFLASTWSRYGVDGDGDGRVDRWSAPDAIFSAANYLHAAGAPARNAAAIFAYNHAAWYVADVQRWAHLYRGPTGFEAERALAPASLQPQSSSPTPVVFVAGEQARLAPGDGHLALIPAGAPSVVQAMVIAGNELQGLAYGPAGHPDPRGAAEEDCSSTVSYVLYRAGVRPIAEIVRDNPLAQDYTSWGQPGPGRWVTIYATRTPTAHVFLTVAGLRLDTSHNGTDTGPNRDEDGPRWRLFDSIPAWARWSVRHPPGL